MTDSRGAGTAERPGEHGEVARAPVRATCRAMYCLTVAQRIDLDSSVERLVDVRRPSFQHKGPIATGSKVPQPVRGLWHGAATRVGPYAVDEDVEVALYDSGVVVVTWRLPWEGPLEELVGVPSVLYDNQALASRSRTIAREVVTALGSAVEGAREASHVEDYVVVTIHAGASAAPDWMAAARPVLASILRAEEGELSEREIEDALSNPVAYRPDEVCLIDWLGAVLIGADVDDEWLVLELANVELLQLRALDDSLGSEIQEAHELLVQRRTVLSGLRTQSNDIDRISRMQADDALMHERIDNALKLLGDDYLARVYRTASKRFHFDDWDAAIERKLAVLRDIHKGLSEAAAHRRSEALEWIIILLIAVDIVLYFVG